MIDPNKMYEGIEYEDGSKETRGVSKVGSGGVVNALGSLSGSETGGKESMSSEGERDETGYAPGERKKGILRKRMLHKV